MGDVKLRWWLLTGAVGLVLTMSAAFASNLHNDIEDMKQKQTARDVGVAVQAAQLQSVRETVERIEKWQVRLDRRMDEVIGRAR